MAAVHGEELLTETLAAIASTREQILQIPGLGVLDESMVGRAGIAGWDPLRLSVDVRGTGSTGYRLAKKLLYSRGIDLELYSENVVVGRLRDGRARPQDRRAAGRHAARRGRGTRSRTGAAAGEAGAAAPLGRLGMTPREAYLGPQEDDPLRGMPSGPGSSPPRGSPPHRQGCPTCCRASG